RGVAVHVDSVIPVGPQDAFVAGQSDEDLSISAVRVSHVAGGFRELANRGGLIARAEKDRDDHGDGAAVLQRRRAGRAAGVYALRGPDAVGNPARPIDVSLFQVRQQDGQETPRGGGEVGAAEGGERIVISVAVDGNGAFGVVEG